MPCCQLSPAILLLPLPQLGHNERQDQQADDYGQHADGQRDAQCSVHRVLTGLTPVAQRAFTNQTGATTRRNHTGAMAVALSFCTGGQVIVDASGFGIRERGGHSGGGGRE